MLMEGRGPVTGVPPGSEEDEGCGGIVVGFAAVAGGSDATEAFCGANVGDDGSRAVFFGSFQEAGPVVEGEGVDRAGGSVGE
jgi:hypothetical protein